MFNQNFNMQSDLLINHDKMFDFMLIKEQIEMTTFKIKQGLSIVNNKMALV